MKILITTDWYTPTVNGVVTSVLNLRKELMLRGHDVRVLTLSQNRHSFESDGVTYIGSVGIGKIYPGARIRAAFSSSYVQKLVDWEPDIIHSQCEFSTFLIAQRIAKTLDIPIIHTYHTVYEDYTHYFMPNKRWGRFMVASLSRWTLGHTACVIAPTEKVRTILSGYGVDRDIHVIPTGIDMSRFTKSPTEERRREIKSQLGIPSSNGILLFVGRLAKEKNLEELLRYHAKSGMESLTFLIVGDGPHRSELEEMAAELGIEDSVRFAGMISPEHIADYYHIADLFVSASGSETQGLTYIEALASGIPALCRKDECLDGVVQNGLNGWQYEDEKDYLEKLDSFFSCEKTRENMKENARELARRTFSSPAFAEKVECVCFEVLGEAAANEKEAC